MPMTVAPSPGERQEEHMNLTCRRHDLVRLLRIVRRAAPVRSTLPYLECVQLCAKEDTLTLAATNLEIGLVGQVEAEVAEAGTVFVRTPLIWAAVKAAKGERLTLEVARLGERTVLTVGDLAAPFTAEPALFPPVRFPGQPEERIDLPTQELAVAIKQIAYSASRDARKPLRTCIWFQAGPSQLVLAAADGARLARRIIPLPAGGPSKPELWLVPTQALLTVARLLPRSGGASLLIHPKRGVLGIRAAPLDVLIRVLDPSQTPDRDEAYETLYHQASSNDAVPLFEQVIPQHYQALVAVSKMALSSLLRKRLVPVCLSLQDERHLELTTYESHGALSHVLPVESWGSLCHPVWLSMRFLAEAVALPGMGPTCILAFGEQLSSPLLLRGEGREGIDPHFSAVIMPLHVASLSREPAIRQTLAEPAEILLTQLRGRHQHLTGRTGEFVQAIQEQVAYQIAFLVAHHLHPPADAIQQAKERLQKLANWQSQDLLDASRWHESDLVQMLADGAFAPEGSCLDLPALDLRLAFQAEALRTWFCQRPPIPEYMKG